MSNGPLPHAMASSRESPKLSQFCFLSLSEARKRPKNVLHSSTLTVLHSCVLLRENCVKVATSPHTEIVVTPPPGDLWVTQSWRGAQNRSQGLYSPGQARFIHSIAIIICTVTLHLIPASRALPSIASRPFG